MKFKDFVNEAIIEGDVPVKFKKMKFKRAGVYGMTEIYYDVKTDYIKIVDGGNMGRRLEDVQYNVDRLLGAGSFNAIRKTSEFESGSPDYLYIVIAPWTLGKVK